VVRTRLAARDGVAAHGEYQLTADDWHSRKGPISCTPEEKEARRKARQRLRAGFIRVQCIRCGVYGRARLPEARLGPVCRDCVVVMPGAFAELENAVKPLLTYNFPVRVVSR
jgi:hypothetical protein